MSETTRSIQPLTATQRALSLAEIVGLIISCMPRNGPGWGRDLLSCALVNKLWLEDSLSMMWRSIHNDHRPLDDGYENPGIDITFLELRYDRRQFYANFVCCAMINLLDDSWEGEDPWAEGGEFEGLLFPKMTVLHVMLTDIDGMLATGSNTCDGEAVLPSLNCPNLHTMSFELNDTNLVSYEVAADTWESIFWDLPTKFPSLQHLELNGHAHIFPNALRRLQKRHPNLQGLEYLDVHEIRRFLSESELAELDPIGVIHDPMDNEDMDSDDDPDSGEEFTEDLWEDDDAEDGNGDDEDYVE
ncbi:hypothetical protein N7467_008808 [Penicillium canescens]|nr:hypothetical protein N7467_008808 [Penicillium canescens]